MKHFVKGEAESWNQKVVCYIIENPNYQMFCWTVNAETTKYDYDIGKVYVFDYLGETISRINGTSDEESRLHLRTLAEFEVVSKCEFVLRVIFLDKCALLF